MLLCWLETGQHGLHDVRQVLCKTRYRTIREDVDDVEPVGVPCNRHH
jgi:hypothetical protein